LFLNCVYSDFYFEIMRWNYLEVGSEAQILQKLEGHQSLAYAGDWLDDKTIMTCSFYDSII